MEANFAESVSRVFADEGGYTNDPQDPGGATNWGITIADARAYWKRDASPDDVRAMPKSVAERIYKTKYWDAMRCGELPSGLDYAVMDFGVNSGISRAIKFLEDLCGLTQDGRPDDTLIKMAASLPTKTLIAELCDNRLKFLRGLKTWPHFGKGWGARVSRVRDAALSMALDVPLPAPKPVKQTENKSESGKTEKPETATKPAIKSSEIWANLIALVGALGGALTDWHFLVFVGVMAIGYVLYRRFGRGDIMGIIHG